MFEFRDESIHGVVVEDVITGLQQFSLGGGSINPINMDITLKNYDKNITLKDYEGYDKNMSLKKYDSKILSNKTCNIDINLFNDPSIPIIIYKKLNKGGKKHKKSRKQYKKSRKQYKKSRKSKKQYKKSKK